MQNQRFGMALFWTLFPEPLAYLSVTWGALELGSRAEEALAVYPGLLEARGALTIPVRISSRPS